MARAGPGAGGRDAGSTRCRAADKTPLCLPTRAPSLGKQKRGRTILPVHGGIVTGSVLQTMSSVMYSVFLLRKGFPGPAPCQVVCRRAGLPGLTRAASAGCKDTTAGPVSAGLPVPWPQPASPHRDRDHYAIQPQPFPHPGRRLFQLSPRCTGSPGWGGMFSDRTPRLHSRFREPSITVPSVKRDQGPPGACQQEQSEAQLKTPSRKYAGGRGGGQHQGHTVPSYTLRSAGANSEVTETVLKIRYHHLERGIKIVGIHQIKTPAKSGKTRCTSYGGQTST